MLHDIFNPAVEDIAQVVNGVDLHVFIPAKPVKLGAVDIVVGVQVILSNAPVLHGFPQPVVFDHWDTSDIVIKI